MKIEKIEKKISESQTVNLNSCSLRIIKFGSENKLIANDKESCSLILMMELLEEDGVAVGVLKEGLFFDGKYKDLRKMHISGNFPKDHKCSEKCDLKKVYNYIK
jgi:hypothetical protein